MLKVITALFLSLSLIGTNIYAQMPGGGMTPPDFDAQKAAGIYTYDFDEVVRKLKINDKESREQVAEALKIFNTKMDQLSYANTATFKELEDEFDRNVKIAMQNRDRSQMNGVKAKIEKTIPPLRMQVKEEEKVLNESLSKVFSEKQYKKWLNYQKKQDKSQFPANS